MLYRRIYGIGRGGGLGYGRGRGGLPRCGYFSNTWAAAPPFAYEAPFAWQMTQAKEVDFLKNEAALLKSQLEQAQARIRTLETNKNS